MYIYSKKIIQFIQEVTFYIKQILREEIKLKVFNDRFYDFDGKINYPISVVVFNDKNILGYFNLDFYEIGIHENLMFSSKKQLKDVIRHELAHYMVCIQYGKEVPSHGREFRSFCKSIGWGKDVYRASSSLDFEAFPQEDSRILQKVKKLMALSSSCNSNEAEQAMVKAQQLLLKHNINAMDLESKGPDGLEDFDQNLVLKRILKQKKKDAKMQAIAIILRTFFVSVVYNRTEKFTYLKILGSPTNIQIADYVANFLQTELDFLWEKTKKEYNLKGLVAKNSFFNGIAKGYTDKVENLKKQSSIDVSNALMVIKNQLKEAEAMVYERLKSSKSQSKFCPFSSGLGKEVGNSLSINPAVTNTKTGQPALLT